MSVCDPMIIAVVGGKSLFGDSVRSFPNDSIFACKTKVSGRQEQEEVFVAMEFTDQDILSLTEVAMELVGRK